MRGNLKRAGALAALAMAGTLIAGTTGSMAAGSDTPGWIEQSGNGHGESQPVMSGLNVQSVLFNNARFAEDGIQRPDLSKYLAFGVNGAGNLARTIGGEDGLSWSAPKQAVLQNAGGVSAPFALDTTSFFDVVYTPLAQYPFSLYYRIGTTAASAIGSLHRAASQDGLTFFNDQALTQDATVGVLNATFALSSNGPSDVIYQPTKSNATTCGAVSGWNCRYVMLYDATNAYGSHSTGLASSPDGVNFTGLIAAILSPGTSGAWDDTSASNASVRTGLSPAGPLSLYYSGGQVSGPKSIGVATSTDGLTWTKTANNPGTAAALLGASLSKASAIDDASGSSHAHIYISLPTSLALAATAAAPTTGPSIRFDSPADGTFSNVSGTKVQVFLNDTLGTNIGEDMSTLSVTIDGVQKPVVPSLSLVTAFTRVGHRITRSADITNLAEGLHSIVVSIKDFDGNLTTATSNFTIDTTAPVSTMDAVAATPQIGFPDSIGTYTGGVTEAVTGTALARVYVDVTNPLGATSRYLVKDYQITKDPLNPTRHWTVRWVAPSLDTHTAVPGTYTLSFLGQDVALNLEKATVANTQTVMVL